MLIMMEAFAMPNIVKLSLSLSLSEKEAGGENESGQTTRNVAAGPKPTQI
jgi:hypothetical protein